MIFDITEIDGILLMKLERNEDARGSFSRAFCEGEFHEAGFSFHVSQANLSKSCGKGTLHFLG